MRKPGIGTVSKIIAVGAITIGGIAGGIQILHGGGSTGSGTGNVFLDAAGSDTAANCQRYSTRTDPGGQVCGTFDKAYSLASPGDSVLIRGGTFTASQNFSASNRKADGSSCNYLGSTAGCITFQPETGQTVTFNVTNLPTSAANPSNQIDFNCATYVRLKNITFAERDFTDTAPADGGGTDSHTAVAIGQGDNTCATVGPPHDDILENLTVGGAASLTGGIYNSCVVNTHAASARNIPWHFSEGGYNNGTLAYSHDNCMIGNTFDGFNFVDNNNLHMECVTMFSDTQHPNVPGSMSNNIIRNNKFLDCPTGVEGFFMQIDGNATGNNNLFEGNVFTGTAAFPLKISCHSTGGTVTNTTVRFNTFSGNNATWDRNGTCSESGNVSYGNLNADCPTSPQATSSRNVFTVASCATDNGTSSFSATPAYTSAGSPNYDYSLANCTQTAGNFVTPAQVVGYPALDQNGVTRPQGASLEAGAYESCSGAGNKGTGGSLAVCSPSPCTTGTPVSHTVNVFDSNTNQSLVTKSYWITKPVNLQCTASVPCPLVVVANCPTPISGCGGTAADATGLTQLANTEKFVLMFIPGTHPAIYGSPVIGRTAGIGPATCGSNGATLCDDSFFVVGALQQSACIGASPCENIDPNKIFMTGQSTGGAFTHDLICDSRTSSYFRGASIVSNTLVAPTNQPTPPNCPAVLGTTNGFGGAAGLSPNLDLSVQWLYGTNDSVACSGITSACLDTGFLFANGAFDYSIPQLAGEANPTAPATGAGSAVAFGRRLGCPSSPTSTVTDTAQGGNVVTKTYAGCTISFRATESVRVAGAGHACSGLAQVDGFDCSATIWNFFKAH